MKKNQYLHLNTTKSAVSQVILAGADFVFFMAGLFLAWFIVWVVWGDILRFVPEEQWSQQTLVHGFLALCCVGWFWVRLRHYTYRKPFWFELKEILRTVLIFAIFDLAILAFSKAYVSRYVWVLTWVSVACLLPLGRFLTKKILRRSGIWLKDCIIIGTGPNAIEAYKALRGEKELGLRFKYFFAAIPCDQREIMDLRVVSNERVLWRTTDTRHTQYVLALDDGQEDLREQWVQKLALHQCRVVSVVPTLRGIPLNSTDVSYLFRYELLLLKINTNLTKRSARLTKRTFDLIVAILISVCLSPLLLFLALWVMRDGGSPIYKHMRVGRDGKLFPCWKFRSMVRNSEQVLQELLATDAQARAEWETDFKLRNDIRITRAGHFLRKTSLDELPQLWNVIRGEMSLVGPRPIVEEELERYGSNQGYYFMAKPGMTGLWQVSGRNNVDYATRVYFDAWYVKNWSLWNDIVILAKTVEVVLKREGAY